MDEETKSALDALLGERKAKRAFSTRDSLHEHMRAEELKRMRERIVSDSIKDAFVGWDFGKSKSSEAYKPAPIDKFNCVASTRDLTAILSIHPAKACVVLRARVTSEFVAELQKLGDATQVEWKPDDKIFYINPTLLPALKLLLKQHYADVQVFGVQKQVKATKFDALMERLSKDDKNKVYRLLAGIYHPDRGGDKDTMALINQVFKGE